MAHHFAFEPADFLDVDNDAGAHRRQLVAFEHQPAGGDILERRLVLAFVGKHKSRGQDKLDAPVASLFAGIVVVSDCGLRAHRDPRAFGRYSPNNEPLP